MRLHHVQITMPRGQEERAREFYNGLLGLEEIAKPDELAGRGGVWFRLDSGELHLGIEESGPESRRHVALAVDSITALQTRMSGAGVRTEEAVPLANAERFYCYDPFGNKLELLQLHDSP